MFKKWLSLDIRVTAILFYNTMHEKICQQKLLYYQ